MHGRTCLEERLNRMRPMYAPTAPLAASPSFGECFQMFDLLHTITTKHASITRITRWVGLHAW